MAAPEPTTPATTPMAPGKQPAIFVMPEKYRGGAQQMAAPKPPEAKPVPMPMAAPVVQKPMPPKPPSGKPVPKKKSNAPKALAIVGLLFVIVLGVSAYYLLRVPAPQATVPEPLPIPTPPPAPVPPPEPLPPPTPTLGTDVDNDGLTNVEETLIYGSDPTKADTDGDTYPDGLEVANRYNPAAIAPKTLFDAGIVKADDAGNFTMLYPSAWTATVGLDGETHFAAPTGEEVVASGLRGEPPPADAVPFTTKNGLQAFRSADGRTVYVPSLDDQLHYDIGIKTTIDYRATFDMMVDSVMVKKPTP